jgi:hypothetical protein
MARWTQCLFAAGATLLAISFGLTLAGSPAVLLAHPTEDQSEKKEGEQICPLTPQQDEESAKAFAAMMPIFTHPRCINCHGAVNPFEANTPHVSGRVGKVFTQVTFNDEILGRDVTIVVVDEENKWRRCKDCHSAFDAFWQLPPPDKWFVGKNTLQLCQQNKRIGNAEGFLEHLEHDLAPGPFIEESFKGTRALDENGQATYENETGRDFKPEPPPITHAQFIEQGKEWVKAMGGEFTGGLDCGCKPHKYALELTYHLLYQDPQSKLASETKAILPVKFVKFKEFTAEGSAEIRMLVSHHDPVMDCKDSYMQFNPHWQATGMVGGESWDPKLQIKFTVSQPPGYIAPMTCTVHGKTSTTPGSETVAVNANPLPPVEMDAVVGAQATINPGPSQKIDVKLVEQE